MGAKKQTKGSKVDSHNLLGSSNFFFRLYKYEECLHSLIKFADSFVKTIKVFIE